MKTVIGEIKKLAELPSYSKHDRLVQGIINAIDEKVLVTDEMLPSINTMIRELKFSRDTVVKGYQELINRGLVGSNPRKGILYHQWQDGADASGGAPDVQYGYLRRTVLPELPGGTGAECAPERLFSPRQYRYFRDHPDADQREIRDVRGGADPASADPGVAGSDPVTAS
jgi:DNA-binding transcriptional MocR family regulator